MDTLLRYGSGDFLYTFKPEDQLQLRDNFRNLIPRTSKIPGLSGSFDEQGSDIAPTEDGDVRVTFWLLADTNKEMQAKKEAVGRMKTFGKVRLYKQPEDASQFERYCEARVNAIDFNEKASDQPHKFLRMSINFQVPDNPRWLTIGTESPGYNDGSLYNSGVVYGGNPDIQNLVGVDNTFSLSPAGNDISFPRFIIRVPTGKSATNVIIQREVNSLIVDKIRYAATLASEETLQINCRAYSVVDSVGADAYSDDFSFETAAWMRLYGGISNNIRVLMDNPADEITLESRFYEAYNV